MSPSSQAHGARSERPAQEAVEPRATAALWSLATSATPAIARVAWRAWQTHTVRARRVALAHWDTAAQPAGEAALGLAATALRGGARRAGAATDFLERALGPAAQVPVDVQRAVASHPDLMARLMTLPHLDPEALSVGVRFASSASATIRLLSRPEFPQAAALAYADDWLSGDRSRTSVRARHGDGAWVRDPEAGARPAVGGAGRFVPVSGLTVGLLCRAQLDAERWEAILASLSWERRLDLLRWVQELSTERAGRVLTTAVRYGGNPPHAPRATLDFVLSLTSDRPGGIYGARLPALQPLVRATLCRVLLTDLELVRYDGPDPGWVTRLWSSVLAGDELAGWSAVEVAAALRASDRPTRLRVLQRLGELRRAAPARGSGAGARSMRVQ